MKIITWLIAAKGIFNIAKAMFQIILITIALVGNTETRVTPVELSYKQSISNAVRKTLEEITNKFGKASFSPGPNFDWED